MIEEAACSGSREPYLKRPLFVKGASQAKKFYLRMHEEVRETNDLCSLASPYCLELSNELINDLR
jgi:hypothetical protein